MITEIIEPVIWYKYKGDEICWNGEKYQSLLCCGRFDDLKEMDNFWEEIYKENEASLGEFQ